MTYGVPEWASAAIWYSVYPLGACGAPIREPDIAGEYHRLGRLLGWLDHVVAVGANGLALGPIWASSTHGYDVVDHDAIDPRLGDDHDFDQLIGACHQRGLKVLLDGVFNHVSVRHEDVQRARTDGVESPFGQLFRHDEKQADGLARFEGHEGLVEYDHSNPAVAERVAATMLRWLDRGADGWRLDAAYRVPRAFWAVVTERVKSRYPNSLTVAEVLHGNYAAFAAETGVDSVTQYELWKAIWSSLKEHNPHELAWALQRHETGMADGAFLPWTFVGNHDVSRITTQIGGHDALIAAALLSVLPGMPAIYYGDELGFTGVKEERIGGDDAIRPALSDEPPPFNESMRQYQLLFGFRRRHAWLQWAQLEITDSKHQHLAFRLTPSRKIPGQDRVVNVTLDATGASNHLVVADDSGESFSL